MWVYAVSSLRQARRPRASEAIRILAGAGPDGIEVAAEHDAGDGIVRVSRGESSRLRIARTCPARGFLKTHSDFGELSGSRCASTSSSRFGPSVGLHADRRAERHAALARQRQLERERIEQRLGGDDRVAAILAQLRAVAHRRHIQHRQPERRGVIVDIERFRIARADRERGSIARVERRHLRRRGDRAPARAARNARPGGRRSSAPDRRLRDQVAKLALGQMRVPRQHHQIVQRGQRGRWPARRSHEHRRADGPAPPRQFAGVRLVADVPVDPAVWSPVRHRSVGDSRAGRSPAARPQLTSRCTRSSAQ